MNDIAREAKIKDAVRQSYGSIARRFTEQPAPSPNQENITEEPARTSCCGSNRSSAPKQSAGCCGSSRPSAPKQSAGCCSSSRPAAHSQSAGCCGSSQAAAQSPSAGCCGSAPADAELTPAADRFYSPAELSGLPDTVTEASLGCGNPIAIADLRPGEVVLDLGSGGGIDCFLAARQVGPAGRVIGLDMTPDMIKLARRNAKKVGAQNVDFRYGEMEDIPLPDGSVDVIISNCVINLSPDKDAVFREVYRVLRPGGWMSVSDIVVDGDLPQAVRDNLDAWAGCIAGALDESVYLDKIRAAGFENVEIVSRDPAARDPAARDYAARDEPVAAEDTQVASIKVRACKPS